MSRSSKNKLIIKRKDDSDSLSLRSPFLDLEELRDVPLKDLPTTAHEFLVSVIAERRNTVAARYDGALENLRKNQSLFFDQEPLPPVHHTLKPTKEWQHIQIADFSEVKSYVSRMQNKKETTLMKYNKEPIRLDGDTSSYRDAVEKNKPNLTSVIHLKQAKIDQELVKLTKLTKATKPGDSIHYNTGQWIYALLTCLKQPLHSDSISILRELAKECWKVRSKINPECEKAKELSAPQSLIICIIGLYYRQLDLADSLE